MNAYLFNDFEVNVKIHGEDLLISCEDVSKCIDEEWVDIYFYKNKCYREFSDNIHWIDDTTLTSYLTIENKKEFKNWLFEEIRRPWWEQVAAEEEKQKQEKEKKKEKETVYRNRNWDVYTEDARIPVSAIGRKYKLSGQKVNEFLREKGIIFKEGRTWYLRDEYYGKGYIYIYEGTNKNYDYEHLYWTKKGADWINSLLREAGYTPIA